MLWQLVRNRRPHGWAGLPAGFSFEQFRRVLPADLIVADVLLALTKNVADLNVILGIDGLQMLPGFDEPRRKDTVFYRTLQAVCRLVNDTDGPFFVGVVAATVQNCIEQALASSPQARVFIDLPLVDHVSLQGKPVLNVIGDKLLRLLVKDMGGHGRALEALVEAVERYGTENPAVLMENVRVNLCTKYPKAVPANFEPILKTALSGKWLAMEETIDGFDVERMQLVRLHWDEFRTSRRISVPYIWIYIGLTSKGVAPKLQKWRLNDYIDLQQGPDGGGNLFEDFCADFRALQSWVYDDGTCILLSDLHRGALLNPPDLNGIEIINKHLHVVKAAHRTATNAKVFGARKPDTNTRLTELRHGKAKRNVEMLDGTRVDMTLGTHIMRNAQGAPAADFAALHTNIEGYVAECGQTKQGAALVTLDVIQDERQKACDDGDVLVIYCTRKMGILANELPRMTGLVGAGQWNEYFGHYVGRAFVGLASVAGE